MVVKTTLGKTIFIFSSPLLDTACPHTTGNTGLQAVQSHILILAGENCTASRFDMLSAVAIKSSHAPEKASLRLERNAGLGGPDILDACRASSNRCRESPALLREPAYHTRPATYGSPVCRLSSFAFVQDVLFLLRRWSSRPRALCNL